MTSTSRLLVIEIVIVPAISQSRSPPPEVCRLIPPLFVLTLAPLQERNPEDAPWPLLKDYGQVNRYAHHQSMELMNIFNGLSRCGGALA